MHIIEEKQSEVASDVKDLRDVPLDRVPQTDADSIVRRVAPGAAPVERVSVAAFNSSI
ncbi:hypothetical protein AB0395_11070 [Streptosporangium sp. NPDC051023]|uniref:hypothetical protein n=1 Tax=Streptosporangium sp. NPDC051023 TaxID=3155410 RepID=UPI00344D338C